MMFLKTENISEQLNYSDNDEVSSFREEEVSSFQDEEVILSLDRTMRLQEMKSIIEKEWHTRSRIPPPLQQTNKESGEIVSRNVEIKLLDKEISSCVLEWAKAYLTPEKCKNFGSPVKLMQGNKYWDNVYKKYLCFVVFVDSVVVGVCIFQGVTSVDEGYIPSGYMARKKRKKNDPPLYKNLADLSWLKACPKEKEADFRGVMSHAISFIVSTITSESTKQIRGY